MRWMQTIANSAREFWRVFQAGYFKRNCVFYSLLAKQTYCYDRADAPRFQQHLCIQPLKLINTGNHKVAQFFIKVLLDPRHFFVLPTMPMKLISIGIHTVLEVFWPRFYIMVLGIAFLLFPISIWTFISLFSILTLISLFLFGQFYFPSSIWTSMFLFCLVFSFPF